MMMMMGDSGTRFVMRRIRFVHHHQMTVFIGQYDELVEDGVTTTRIGHFTATTELYVGLVFVALLLLRWVPVSLLDYGVRNGSGLPRAGGTTDPVSVLEGHRSQSDSGSCSLRRRERRRNHGAAPMEDFGGRRRSNTRRRLLLRRPRARLRSTAPRRSGLLPLHSGTRRWIFVDVISTFVVSRH